MKPVFIAVGTAANRAARNTLEQLIGQTFDFIYTESEDGKEIQEELPEECLQQWSKEQRTIVLLATLGGETGRRISLRMVEQLQSHNLFYYFWGTLPFIFEGRKRIVNALQASKDILKTKNRCFVLLQHNDVDIFYPSSLEEAWDQANYVLTIFIAKIILIHNWLVDMEYEYVLENVLNELIHNAENGDVHAQVKLGKIYCCNQDFEKAIAWFKKAAEQGNDDAQLGLGLCYEFGYESGIKSDIKQVSEWYKKSAAQKNELAQKYLNLLDLTCSVNWE